MRKVSALIQTMGWGIGKLWQERPRFLNNPIILRELVTQLRKKQSFFYLFLFLAVATLIFTLGWNDFLSRGHLNLSLNLSWQMLLFLSISQGIVLLLIVPLFSATAINLETERETWDLLQTSPIALASIIVGKLLSSFLFVGIILVSMIPIYSMILPMGSVSPQEILVTVAALMEEIAIAATIGLFCSIRWKRTVQSISFAYIFCFLYFFAMPFMPIFLTNSPSVSILFSPFLLILYVVAPNDVDQILKYFNISQTLTIHFICMAFIFLFLLMACAWQMMPRTQERAGRWLERMLISLARLLGKPTVLIGFVWIVVWKTIAVIVYYYQSVYFSFEMLFVFAFFLSAFLLVLFPLIGTVFFHEQWARKPWDVVASTPSKLERMLYRCLGYPLILYAKWMAGIAVFFIFFFFVIPKTIDAGLWFILFGAITVLWISIIGMVCTLITRSLFLSLVHTYAIIGFFFLFLPISLQKTAPQIGKAISPIELALLPLLDISWRFPFRFLGRDLVYGQIDLLGVVFLHGIGTLVIFIILLLFCQRRLLKIAGCFKRESIWNWVKRNLFNIKPSRTDVPLTDFIPFFPEKGNPVAIRELREYFLHKRTNLIKTSIWILIASMILFWLLPFSSQIGKNLYQNMTFPLTIIFFFIPFFIVPYAANSFRREQDQQTWDLISTTTLSFIKMLHGKLWAGFMLFHARCGVFLTPVIIIGLVLWIFGDNRYIYTGKIFLIFLAIGYPFFLFILSFSTYVSIQSQKTTTSYIVSLVIPYLLLFSPAFLSIMGYRSSVMACLISPLSILGTYRNSIEPWWQEILITQVAIYLLLAGLFYCLTYSRLRLAVYRK